MGEEPAYYAVIPAGIRYDNELSPNAKLLFGEITALCNQNGYCWAGNDYFSKLYNVSKGSISRLIKQLKEKGYIYVELVYKNGTKEIKHRYIKIVPDPMHKNVNTYAQKCETPMHKIVKENITSINNTSNNIDHSLKDRFEMIWDHYPSGRKQGKDSAFKSYKRAIKDGVTDETILKGLDAYKQQIKLQKTEVQFIKQGGTWFNGKCWNDEYMTQTKSSNKLEYVDVPKEFRT